MNAARNNSPTTPPPPEEPQQPEPATSNGPSQNAQATTAQATAAATAAVSAVRERLMAGEQFILGAAGGIVIIYLIWQFLLDFFIMTEVAVVLAVLTVLAIWVHRWGHYDFGRGYRILIGALGVALALFALMNLLTWARAAGGGDFLGLIGRLLFWAAGVAAFVGGWQVFRTREN
jgi:hypothetical protein